MKIKIHHIAAALLLSAFCFPLSAFSQGSLTPPGAPAPTMKSLDQIEARTAITNTASLVTLSQPGSYYLMHNLTVSSGDAIDITANQVTLDLNGFTISSTASSPTGYAIQLAGAGGNSDITIFNGHIKGGVTNNAGTFSGPGFGSGIDLPGSIVQNVRVTGVSVSGCLNYGIYLGTGDSTVVESCTVKTVNNGIVADSVSHCTAQECGDYGIYAKTALDCRGVAIGSGIGLLATTANNCHGQSTSGAGLNATTANNCYGQSTSGTGLSALTANNCYGSSSSSTGLYVSGVAIGCYGQSSSGVGINAHIANSCVVGGGTTNITYKYNMP